MTDFKLPPIKGATKTSNIGIQRRDSTVMINNTESIMNDEDVVDSLRYNDMDLNIRI